MEDPERHTSIRYEEALNGLRATLVKMGRLVDAQISRAMASLADRDAGKASERSRGMVRLTA